MENHIQNIELINKHINKSLSENESIDFLNRLKIDIDFKDLYKQHSLFLEGLKRQTLKAEIKSAKYYYTKMKWIKYIGISSVIVVASIAICFLLLNNNSDETVVPKENNNPRIISDSISSKEVTFIKNTLSETEKEGIKEIEVLDKQQSKNEIISLESLKKSPQTFVINSKKDTTLVCNEGTKLTVKANSFVDKNNNIAEGNITISVTEYYKVSDMLLANLSTTSDDKQLETGGMLYIEAKKGDSMLKLKENAGIEIHFPTQNKKDNMQLFSGEWNDGIINWNLEKSQDTLVNLLTNESIPAKIKKLGDDDVEVPFAVIEQVPIYPGCENLKNAESKKCMTEAISKFVQNNFNTNIAASIGLKGRQRINALFKINKNGDIVSIQSRGPHPVLEAEADRIIGLLPKMQPGKQRNKPVTVPYSLPIIFQLDGTSGKASIDNRLPMTTIPTDSIITSNFENSLKKEATISNKSSSVNSYILRTLNLGWINCDRFIRGRAQRIKYRLKDNDGNKAVVSMIFKSINSVLPSHNINGIYNFGTVGNNEDIVLVAIQKDNGKLYFDAIETKTKQNPYIQFNFKEVSIEELKDELNKLNKLFQ